MSKGRLRGLDLRGDTGQSLLVLLLILPVLVAFAALVLDGGHAFAQKRAVQNAADAAALAAAQDIGPALVGADDPCRESFRGAIEATAEQYSLRNGGPAALAECDAVHTNNCYSWPYNGSWGKLEIKLSKHVDGFFTGILGTQFFEPAARAVASAAPITETHCVFDPPVANPDQYLSTTPPCHRPGTPDVQGVHEGAVDAHGQFDPPVADPDQYLTTTPPCLGPLTGGIDGAVAFVMSRACNAISYTGAGGGSIGAFATNGGIEFLGSRPKKVRRFGYNKTGCPNNPVSPPSGDAGACTATAWEDPTDSDNMCVKELVDLSARVPLNWPLTPPTAPSPLPPGTTWDPALHYPSRCIPITATTFSSSSGPPGIYCFTASNAKLTITGDLTSGDGYTFFALNGSRIEVNSNPSKVKFYWPSACGARPTSRPTSGCFGLTSAYDPQTLFYATSPAHDANCDRNAVCIHGGNANLDGDIFAVEPGTFPPPSPTTTGRTVFVAGGSASAGSGFIETWWLSIQGNTGSYTGTGMGVGGSPQVGTFDPGENAHCIFDPPVPDPDSYLSTTPPCFIAGTPDQQGTPQTSTTHRFSMDE